MEIRRIEEISLFEDQSIVTIGAFDSIHIGHEKLLNEMLKQKKNSEYKYKTIVFTFDMHPDYYLHKRNNNGYLQSKKEKNEIFKNYEIDYLVILGKDILGYSYKEFHKEILNKVNTKTVVVGSDFVYGLNKEGNVNTLKEDYNVIDLLAVNDNGQKISSTEIRNLLEQGKVEEASKLLGKPYSVSGVVIRGAGLGRKIGIPTANISCHEIGVKIADGVYGTIVKVSGEKYLGITNIGKNPTVNTQVVSRIETHIIDFDGDLYGKKIEIDFIKYIRGEIKFANVDDLVKMVKKNIEDFKKGIN